MRRRLIALAILALGIAGFLLLKYTRPEPVEVKAEERSWRVETQTVRPARHQPELSLYGQLTAPRQVTLSAPVAAVVAERPVQEGEAVRRGQVLLRLADADLQPLLADAEADVADSRAQLTSERVRHRADQAALESEQDIVANAERQLSRIATLVERNLASRDQLEAATDALARARLALVARQQALDDHPSRLQRLQAQLQRASARLSSVQRDLQRSEVVAPFDGRVTNLQVAPGDQVNRYQALLTVYPDQGLELRARVPQGYRQELAAALAEDTPLQAKAVEGDARFRLVRFAGQSDPTGTEAIFRLQGRADGLRPGAMVPVILQRPAVTDAVAVPFSALYGNDSVYVVNDQGRMQRIAVTRLGELRQGRSRPWTLIASPELATGQQLVVTHLPNAVNGLRVDVVKGADS